jgi:transposase
VGVDLYAPLYRDEKRRAQEIEHFIRKLVEIERQAEEKKFSKKQDVEHYTEELSEGCGKLFQIIVKQGRIQLKRKAKVISYLINRMGKMILLTNDGQLKRDELLLWYRRKDSLEKLFDIMKNELEEGRLWTGSKEAIQGRLFVNFLSIVLYAALSQQMKETQLYQSFSVSEVLYELKKLKLVELSNGKSLLTEISKRQRILYQKLNVPIPAVT